MGHVEGAGSDHRELEGAGDFVRDQYGGLGILPQKLVHQEVLDMGERVRDTLVKLLRAILPKYSTSEVR